MSRAAVRLGLIGAGVIGARHLGAMDSVDDIELVGIADPMLAAKAIADERGVPLFADTAALLTKAKPDGVVICTPTEHHLEPCLQALDSGVHVFVENPFAPQFPRRSRSSPNPRPSTAMSSSVINGAIIRKSIKPARSFRVEAWVSSLLSAVNGRFANPPTTTPRIGANVGRQVPSSPT